MCQKTREDQGSSENDERCEFKFVFGNSSKVLDLEKEEPTKWPQQRVPAMACSGPMGSGARQSGIQLELPVY